MEKPLVSIIIPCYNYAHFLPEAIDSIINQKYTNWECIIVDDGSTDNTKDVVHRYMGINSKIKYIYQENKGLPKARNKGIVNCKGKYVQLLDADDFLLTDKIRIQIDTFMKYPSIDIVYSEYLCFFTEDRKNTWTYSRVQLKGEPINDFVANWEKDLSIPIHCFLYKKECFDKWKLFDTSFIYGKEDWDLHISFAASGAKYKFIDGKTSYYRVSSNSMARDQKKMNVGKNKLLRKYILNENLAIKTKIIFIKRYLENSQVSKIISKLYILLKKSICYTVNKCIKLIQMSKNFIRKLRNRIFKEK